MHGDLIPDSMYVATDWSGIDWYRPLAKWAGHKEAQLGGSTASSAKHYIIWVGVLLKEAGLFAVCCNWAAFGAWAGTHNDCDWACDASVAKNKAFQPDRPPQLFNAMRSYYVPAWQAPWQPDRPLAVLTTASNLNHWWLGCVCSFLSPLAIRC